MAAYGVIGGAIGGAIALAIAPMLMKRNRKRYNKKKHKEPETYYSGTAWFGFICSIVMIVVGILCFLYTLFYYFYYFYFFASFFEICFGIIFACWTGSFLRAKITITKDGLIIDHAAKMPDKEKAKIKMTQLGRHHLNLRWEEIRELRANINFMQIVLYKGERYMFPIGWCKKGARFAVERHKRIKHWT